MVKRKTHPQSLQPFQERMWCSSCRGNSYQQHRDIRDLHITLKFVEVVVGLLTHDGVAEMFGFKLYVL